MNETSLSVIVEWENVQHSAESRALEMLARLRHQVAQLPSRISRPVEILLVYPQNGASAPPLELPSDKDASIIFLPTDGLDYYSQKNYGARQATGDLVLFVDSDVVPQRGWLGALLECFLRNAPQAVCGQTYLEVESRYDYALSGFWIFVREEHLGPQGEDKKVRQFYANNVMFRRLDFLQSPFPETPAIRGRCALLADLITQDGGTIMMTPAARVSHPAPNGLRHFIKRAMADGHDAVVTNLSTSPRHFVTRHLRSTGGAVRRVWRDSGSPEYSLLDRLYMICVPIAYGSTSLLAELGTHIAPNWMRERARV